MAEMAGLIFTGGARKGAAILAPWVDIMSRDREWPSRERWAYQRQHPYWDSETGCPFCR